MTTTTHEQNNITRRVIIVWENPHSQIDEWEKGIQQRKEEDCQARLINRAHFDLEEEEENAFLKKVTNGDLTQLTEKEIALLQSVEKGNQNGGQIGNYGLCVEKAKEAWQREIVIKDNFFMPFEAEVEECRKREEKKIYVVMYHEHVDYEYSHSSVQAVFNTEEAARHWIAAKVKREHKKKRQTKEFVKKGGNPRNLPYGKEYHRFIWEDVWYTVEEKTIS